MSPIWQLLNEFLSPRHYFVQRAVKLAGATLEVIDSRPDLASGGGVSAGAEAPLFVCARHATNTWAWTGEAELRKLDDEFDANYVEICAEAKARAELREEGGFNEDDAPPPDPPHTDDDAPPPALDLGLGGARIMVDAPLASR